MRDEPKSPTVYFDGGCPLCRAEIATYQKSPGGSDIHWCDVTQSPPSDLGPDLDAETALKRFHVRTADGHLLSGAAGFVEVWRHLKNWRWLAHFARIPGMLFVMERSYLLFLRLRPLWRRPEHRT